MNELQLISVGVMFFFVVGAVVAGALYDIWIYQKAGVDSTISRGMQALGRAFPIFPFVVGISVGLTIGVLAGHFWWSQ